MIPAAPLSDSDTDESVMEVKTTIFTYSIRAQNANIRGSAWQLFTLWAEAEAKGGNDPPSEPGTRAGSQSSNTLE